MTVRPRRSGASSPVGVAALLFRGHGAGVRGCCGFGSGPGCRWLSGRDALAGAVSRFPEVWQPRRRRQGSGVIAALILWFAWAKDREVAYKTRQRADGAAGVDGLQRGGCLPAGIPGGPAAGSQRIVVAGSVRGRSDRRLIDRMFVRAQQRSSPRHRRRWSGTLRLE